MRIDCARFAGKAIWLCRGPPSGLERRLDRPARLAVEALACSLVDGDLPRVFLSSGQAELVGRAVLLDDSRAERRIFLQLFDAVCVPQRVQRVLAAVRRR